MKRIISVLFFLLAASPVLACGDESTVTVVVDDPNYEKILEKSGAAYDPFNNVIAISTEYMTARPPNVQKFIYAHECGHYYLKNTESHAFFGNPQAEYDADDFAMKTAKENGVTFTEEELSYICNDVGKKRCERIREMNEK